MFDCNGLLTTAPPLVITIGEIVVEEEVPTPRVMFPAAPPVAAAPGFAGRSWCTSRAAPSGWWRRWAPG